MSVGSRSRETAHRRAKWEAAAGREASRAAALAVLACGVAACASLSGLSGDKAPVDDGGGVDRQTPPSCAADDAGYHAITDKACWSTYELPSGVDPVPGYSGGTFDGRYAYVGSNSSARVVRLDTQSPYSADGSWTSYDTSPVQAAADPAVATGTDTVTYSGAVFDGRYVYLVPVGNDTEVFVRYDSTAPFTSDDSWSAFLLPATNPAAFQGATFDGRYIYFAPNTSDGADSGSVVRYDTTRAFTSAASWSTFDTTTLPGDAGANALDFNGAVFDGRHVYFASTNGSFVTRYDTTTDFASASSWEVTDTSTTVGFNVGAEGTGFQSAAFDGTNVYLVPINVDSSAVAYDISQPFQAPASWTAHTPGTSTTAEFNVGAFDGRRVYFTPGGVQPPLNGLLVAYDNAASESEGFASVGAWSSFDLKALSAGCFAAAVFDGRYLYLAPDSGGTFARFDAKETPAQPKLPGYFGSFF